MSDLHALPLRGHDLPDPAPQAPVRHKVQVFKDDNRWYWYHHCGGSYRTWTWEGAYRRALLHLEWCYR